MPASSALHRALLDFGDSVPSFSRLMPVAAVSEPAASFSREQLERAVAQAEARLRESLAREYDAARRSALSEAVAQALAAERTAHAEAMRALTGEQAAVSAAAIATGLGALRDEVSETIAAACGRLLLPLLKADAGKRAVAALSRVLRESFEEKGVFRVTLSGPPTLRAALLAELADLPLQWQERDAESLDLRAAFGTEVLETRLAEWLDALQGCTA